MRIGFIGTGVIAEAVIEGMLAEDPTRAISVSPRSEAISRALAERHAAVTRAADNQAVVDASDVVCLGVRPEQAAATLDPLTFRADQRVVSFVAGVAAEDLARHARWAGAVCRVTPLPTIARRQGPILIQGATPAITELFRPLGVLVEAADSAEMEAYGCASGVMSSFFSQALAGIGWLTDQGMPRAGARDYLMAMYAGLAETGLRTPAADLDALPARHETTGGLNEACRERLAAAGWFDAYRLGFDAVRDRSRSVAD